MPLTFLIDINSGGGAGEGRGSNTRLNTGHAPERGHTLLAYVHSHAC